MFRISISTLLKINLGVGLLTLFANAGALLLMSRGKSGEWGSAILDAAVWALAGALLFGASIYALVRPVKAIMVARFQAVVVLMLTAALLVWGLSLIESGGMGGSKIVWSLGFLSAAGVYGALSVASVVDNTNPLLRRYGKLLWLIPGLAFVVDVATFIKLAH